MKDHHRILPDLGRRLREAREARGLSLSEVAREADLSRRHLTEVESGRANPSVLALSAIASVLGRTAASLLEGLEGRRVTERIALVGLRGAGKTTIGKRLARELEVPFVELDQRVEAIAGLALGEIFDLHGADAFHRFEAEALEQVLAEGERVVIAAGGSIVDAPDTYERLLATCRTVWLRAEPTEHLGRVEAQGDHRPMRNRPRAMEELSTILERRTPNYSRCEYAADTSRRSVDDVVAELLTTLL